MVNRSLNYGRHQIEKFLEKSIPYDNVLDIGAGTGIDLSIANNIVSNCSLHALEYYPPNISLLESQGIKVNSIDLEKDIFPYDNDFFDVIIANQILEHTKELFWVFHEATRVLKLGGKLIIGVPNLASLHNRILLLLGQHPTSIKSASAHVRGFTRPDLLYFVNSCWPGGFKLIKWGGSNFYPFPPLIAKLLSTILPSMAWGLFMLFKKVGSYNNEFIQFPINENLETNYYIGED